MRRRDPRWKSSPTRAAVPASIIPWLRDPGSLTARIAGRCRAFRVQVCGEYFALPCSDEAAVIQLADSRWAWTREVLLFADSRPVVFAHSVLAPRDLRGAWHMARGMGNRPLGAALFADHQIHRGLLTCIRLQPGHPLHERASLAVKQSLPSLWARRSCFHRHGRPLLVTEVFLPDIFQLSTERDGMLAKRRGLA
jgi:chorismate--pyruvate lyase